MYSVRGVNFGAVSKLPIVICVKIAKSQNYDVTATTERDDGLRAAEEVKKIMHFSNCRLLPRRGL